MTYAKNPSFHERKRINQSETAKDHFHGTDFQYKIVSRQEAFIMDKMQADKDYTIGELHWLTKLDKSTVSGRRYAMLEKGLLVKGAKRKCFFSEVMCETVKLARAL